MDGDMACQCRRLFAREISFYPHYIQQDGSLAGEMDQADQSSHSKGE